MSQSAVARRYAQALLEICDEQGNHDAIQAQFARLVELLGEGPEVGRFLANPTIAEADRVEVGDRPRPARPGNLERGLGGEARP